MLTGASRKCWIKFRPAKPPPTTTTLCRCAGVVGWTGGLICAPLSNNMLAGVKFGLRHDQHEQRLDHAGMPKSFFSRLFCGERVGDSSTVERRTLTPPILVRIQVPQPYNQVILPPFVSFSFRRNSSDMSAGYAPSITMVRFQRRKTAA